MGFAGLNYGAYRIHRVYRVYRAYRVYKVYRDYAEEIWLGFSGITIDFSFAKAS